MLEKPVGSFTCDPRDLVDVVDVRVQAHLLGHIPAFVRQLDERIGPRVGLIRDTTRGHSQAFRGKTNTLDVRNTEESAKCQL